MKFPTDDHQRAVEALYNEIRRARFSSTLVIAGSVARGDAKEKSDVDALCIVDSQDAIAALASIQLGLPVAVSAHHGCVAISKQIAGVKVSIRVLDIDFLRSLFEPREDNRRSIWKSHKVQRDRNAPELVVTATGNSHFHPFHELNDDLAKGYVYPLRLSAHGVPCFNVESTMLLDSEVFGVNELGIVPSDVIAASLEQYIPGGGLLRAFDQLESAGYLGRARRKQFE